MSEDAIKQITSEENTTPDEINEKKEINTEPLNNVEKSVEEPSVKLDIADEISQIVEALSEAASEDQIIEINEEYLQDLSSKSLKDLLQIFEAIIEKGDQQEMYKYSETIKASFYKTLKREKIAAGFLEPSENHTEESTEDESNVSVNPFAEIERGFKDLYSKYKSSRSAFLQELEHKKDENLAVKLQIIDELKSLLETQEDLNMTFPEFRALQTKWRESGPVPQAKVKDVYDTYQHCVEMFYDYVKINNELRDLDFKKNYEAKIDLCEKAEALIAEDNVINAFAKLQKLHEEWKEFGPVEKEFRESIWERFRTATSEINKKHQSHFEVVKGEQKENLTKKTTLCEKAEEIANKEITETNGWNTSSKDLENLQKEWKTIGFASKKENQRIYDRFRAACDIFYNRKREYYSQFKDQMSVNMEKKIALCEQAEAIMDSTDWKKTTDTLISLQKQWKEIGPVSRKKSDQIWVRFRAACDKFFNNKDKNFGGVDPQYVENLEKKMAIIEEVKSFVSDGNSSNDIKAMKDFFNRWNEVGFVPFKEKDRIQDLFKEVINQHFAEYRGNEGGVKSSRRPGRDSRDNRPQRGNNINPARSERERLVQKFRKKEGEIATYENNMGFFASSKNADIFIKEIKNKIEIAKAELLDLEEKIKTIDKQFE